MIETAAQLMDALIAREKAVIGAVPNLNHNGMLGAMYEGLARTAVERAIFKGLDLRVVEGKVRLGDKSLSGQIDAMVVEGQGEQLPHTQSFIYDISQVIAVFEIKKTLRGMALADSFVHLRDIRPAQLKPDRRHDSIITGSWRSLMGRPYPSKHEIATMPIHEEQIRSTLLVEAHIPLRVVLGYDGFKSEHSLRKGLIDFLDESLPIGQRQKKPKAGFGVASFPDLIVSADACLLKMNGMPYASPMPSKFWQIIASHSGSPFRLLLEYLWTRLAHRFNLPATIFGEDLEIETTTPLLDALWHDDPGGWEFRITKRTRRQLAATPKSHPWEPARLTPVEFAIVERLCQEPIPLDEPALLKLLGSNGVSPEALVASLTQYRLIFVRDGTMDLLTEQCSTVRLSDGSLIAGENRTGRLMRWVMQEEKRIRDRKSAAAVPPRASG